MNQELFVNVISQKEYPPNTGWWVKDFTMHQLKILTTKTRYAVAKDN